ncbi:MAG: glycosyltransferase [Candidatus Sumerlaeia bacterium]|nr:glycosyltransferase [Candidatus Sumerlaeia bacterium]
MQTQFLFVTCGYPPAKNAGAEKGLARLADALARRGYRVTVLALRFDAAEPREETNAHGVQILRTLEPLALGPLWGITFRRQVSQQMKALAANWDFVLCNQLFLHSDVAAKVAKDQGKHCASVVVNCSTFSDFKTLLEQRGGKSILQRSIRDSSVMVMTRPSVMEAIHHGYQKNAVRAFRYMVPSLSEINHAPSASRDVLYIGRFMPQKNVVGLIRGFERYAEKHSKLNLILVGDGDLKDDVLAAIKNSPACHRIKRYGWTTEPETFYQRARAVVMFSHSEGLSNVMIEGLSFGKPMVITDVSGAREAIDPEYSLPSQLPTGTPQMAQGGLLIPIGDEEALAKAFEQLEDDAAVDELGSVARKRIETDFMEEHCVQMFLNEVKSIQAGNPEPSPFFHGILP